jgi:branched-chain amino acid transport system ATP-binding protein
VSDRTSSDSILRVDGLCAGYAGEHVVHDISLSVAPGEAITVIGSNGAGKSTLFKAIVGLLKGTRGTVSLDGADISNQATHRIARRGLAYVAAERHLFPHMTVAENLAMGSFPGRSTSGRAEVVFDLFPRLFERRKQHAGTMSGGEQQMLAVGRALMSNPKVLMLDEPTTGLSPRLAVEAYHALARLRDAGLTLVVAEQQVPLALDLASRGYVLENGRIELAGSSDDLARNPDVRRAYLGVA